MYLLSTLSLFLVTKTQEMISANQILRQTAALGGEAQKRKVRYKEAKVETKALKVEELKE